MKKRIHIAMDQNDIVLLDRLAAANGITRAELIRDKLFSNPTGKEYSPTDLAELVSHTRRSTNLPSSQVERLVYTVFTALMSGPREAATPGL